jgi:hypothetical protein
MEILHEQFVKIVAGEFAGKIFHLLKKLGLLLI